ncbi:MAG: S1 family peptidase [Solirubrobacteraceae bacterium]
MHPPSSPLLRPHAAALCAVVLLIAVLTAQANAQVGRDLRFSGAAPPLVFGGHTAEEESFPWMAYVVDFREGGLVALCSGAVVAPRLVLTAGHCVEEVKTGQVDDAAGFRVVTGNVDWTSPERQILQVSQTAVYAKFDRHVANDDAGLLVLSEPTSAPAIALAHRPADRSWLAPGTGALLIGWGQTSFEQEHPTITLRYAETVVQGSRWCKRDAPPFYPRQELCVIDPPHETTGICHGDSGSPLVLDEEGQEEVDLGIASHGYGRCSTHHPGVYTRVDAIYPWVQRWIRSVG